MPRQLKSDPEHLKALEQRPAKISRNGASPVGTKATTLPDGPTFRYDVHLMCLC